MEQELEVAQKSKVPVPALKNISFERGIIPKDYEDVMRMAGLMHASQLAPDSLDTPQKVAVAMMMAMEIGLPIVTGIQNIAVINNKAGLWGDVALALARKSGLLEVFEEWSEGERKTPQWTFFCKIKRKGYQEVINSYSWVEATEAGCHNPKKRNGDPDNFSPWRRFTNRMMQFKARNFPLRDQFGDVLKGMRLAEDLQDAIEMTASGNGTYSIPDKGGVSDSIEALANEFDAKLEPGPPMRAFISTLAEHYGKTEAEIKAEAMQDLDSFSKGYEDWLAKQQPTGSGGAPPPKEEKTLRDEFINIRKPGYSTWVHKNIDRLKQAHVEDQQEAKRKWGAFYSDPWPLNPEPETEEETGDSHAEEGPNEDEQFTKDCEFYGRFLSVEEFSSALGPYGSPNDVPPEEREVVTNRLKEADGH